MSIEALEQSIDLPSYVEFGRGSEDLHFVHHSSLNFLCSNFEGLKVVKCCV